MNRAVHIVSLGCAKNLVDSEVMAAALAKEGYRIVADPREAGVMLVNTCAFILPAREESIEEILRAAAWKQESPGRRLVVTGCLPQRYGKALAKGLPEVDIFLDTNEAPRIAHHLSLLGEHPTTLTVVRNPSFLMDAGHDRLLATPFYSAYLKIAEGCSNYCSYCIIPAIRGKARSRAVADIVTEAERLAAKGVRELIITAQDTTAYGRDLRGHPTLGELLKALAAVHDLRWIRLLYAYPGKLDDRTLTTMAEEEKVLLYLDIPIQHIDDEILKAMHRKGGSEAIMKCIGKIREIMPQIALRTSLIVGFPGETPAKFKKLLAFITATRFAHLGVFTYSQEEETAAAQLTGHITEKTKERRRERIMEEQAGISHQINQSLIGHREEVLVEGVSDIPEYPFVGRCRRQSPEIDGITYVKGMDLAVGDFVPCTIRDADVYDLYAEAAG